MLPSWQLKGFGAESAKNREFSHLNQNSLEIGWKFSNFVLYKQLQVFDVMRKPYENHLKSEGIVLVFVHNRTMQAVWKEFDFLKYLNICNKKAVEISMVFSI